MRLTFNSIRDGLDAINTAAGQFAAAQWQVSTGKRLRAASDDPVAARQAVADSTEIGTLDSYSRATDAASSRLSILDSVLGDIVDKVTQAQSTTQAARGSVSQSVRDTAAVTLAGIRDAIAGDINTTFNGSFLFAGSKAATPYVQVAGVWTYQGDATAVSVDVDRNRTVAFSQDGQAILQGTDPTDLLSTLDSLVTAASTGNAAALTTGMDALSRAFTRATHAQSQVGSDLQSISDGQARLSTLRLASVALLSKDQDANVAEAITHMNQAQIAYQAALSAVGNASKVSLLDYIR